MSMTHHLITFAYIASFFTGVLCLAFLVSARGRIVKTNSIKYKTLRRFTIMLFAFFVANFLIFYNEFFIGSEMFKTLMLVAFDICLVAVMGICISFNSTDSKVRMCVYVVTGGVYVLMWLAAYFMGKTGNPILVPMMQIAADALFCSISIGIIITCITDQVRENEDKWERRYLISLDVILCTYVAVMYCEDLYTLFSHAYMSAHKGFPYLTDPVFIAFAIINVYTLVFFGINLKKR